MPSVNKTTWGASSNRTFFSHSSGGQKSEIKVWARLCALQRFWGSILPCLFQLLGAPGIFGLWPHHFNFLLLLLFNIFISLFGCTGSWLLWAFSSCSKQGRLCCGARASPGGGSLATEHSLQVPGLRKLWFVGLVVLWHVGYSPTKD